MTNGAVCHDCETVFRSVDAVRWVERDGVQHLVCRDRGACLERRQATGARAAAQMRRAGAAEMPGFGGPA